MKLKRLLEADDKELRQVQEIVGALPSIFKEAITTSDYFKKRLPQLAKQMTADQAVDVLDLYVNKDYDIIKVAEKELLTAYFEDPYTLYTAAKTDFIDTLVSSALSDGYVVEWGEVQVGDKFLNSIIDLLHGAAGDLDAKQLDLLISILLQSYESRNIKSSDLLNIDDYIDQIFNGDDEAYRLKCWIFLQNKNNKSKYGLPEDFGFDSIVDGLQFGDMSTKQMKHYMSSQQESTQITLIQWIYDDSGENSDYDVEFTSTRVDKHDIKLFGLYIRDNGLVETQKRLFEKIVSKLTADETDYSKDANAVSLYTEIWRGIVYIKVFEGCDSSYISDKVDKLLTKKYKQIHKYLVS